MFYIVSNHHMERVTVKCGGIYTSFRCETRTALNTYSITPFIRPSHENRSTSESPASVLPTTT